MSNESNISINAARGSAATEVIHSQWGTPQKSVQRTGLAAWIRELFASLACLFSRAKKGDDLMDRYADKLRRDAQKASLANEPKVAAAAKQKAYGDDLMARYADTLIRRKAQKAG